MSQPTPSFYNLAWRWHFYAGLFVAPFMILLQTRVETLVLELGFTALVGMSARFAVAARRPSSPSSPGRWRRHPGSWFYRSWHAPLIRRVDHLDINV